MRKLFAFVLIPLVLVTGCGGGGSSYGGGNPGGGGGGGGGGTQTIATPGHPNVEKMTIDAGPTGLPAPSVNTPFISVQVCIPNTSPAQCQTIDHVEVDTGSLGLRLISSAGGGELTLALPAEMAGGAPLAECYQLVDGTLWGSLNTADITLPVSGETASNVNVQVIGASSVGGPPSGCPGMPINTVATFGANGILGVGPFVNDCNSSGNCTPGVQAANYYTCATAPCSPYTAGATVAEQVQNPVTLFAKDNNGVIVEFASIPTAGTANPTGSLVFGIGTESNNALGSATQLLSDPTTGEISATLNGNVYSASYLDSGSNANFFADSSIANCPSPNQGFFCPNGTVAENATLQGTNGAMRAADFDVANADSLFSSNPSYTAFNDLAGTNSSASSLDLGMPFFFGHNVFTGFENASAGPFFAY